MALTGFLVGSTCQPSSAAAILALNAQFPQVAGNLLVTSTGITFAAPNVFGITLRTVRVDTAAITSGLKTITLIQCDPDVPVLPMTVFDPVLAGGLWMFAITMVLGCWMLAKNSGIIINAIRRL